jgi:hypothetical protein
MDVDIKEKIQNHMVIEIKNIMKIKLLLIVFLCFVSCKDLNLDPTTTILKHIITNKDK